MTQEKPILSAEGRYELREAAKALGISKCSLLRYTHQGLIRSSIRRSNNRRIWTGAEIIRFWSSVM